MIKDMIGAASVLALASGAAMAEQSFKRIASFPVIMNMAEGEDTSRESSPEIIAATADGNTLIYTDSPLGVVGMIDITDPHNPQPLGNVALDGEPTSVVVVGPKAYVGVNTSESYTDPSGHMAIVNYFRRMPEASFCGM